MYWQGLCLLYEEEFRVLARKISSLEKNNEMSLFQIERLEQENKELERRISSLEKKQNETEEKNEK